MRLIAINFLLFLSVTANHAFCADHCPPVDTIKKHSHKHHDELKIGYLPPADKLFYLDCVFIHKYTIAQRLQKYPFSKAAKILAVSYDGGPEKNRDIIIGDTTKIVRHKPHGLHIDNDTLNYESLFEWKQLTADQINRLSNLMFNTDYKIPNDYVNPGYTCFSPRDAFIFFDKNGKVFDYIEICFECKRTKSKSEHLYLGVDCNQKLTLIKKFLTDMGIKFGTMTTKNDD